jgi:hypothetical protein
MAMSTPDAHKAIEREVVALVREFVSRFGRASMDGPRPEPPARMRVELRTFDSSGREAMKRRKSVDVYADPSSLTITTGWISPLCGSRQAS